MVDPTRPAFILLAVLLVLSRTPALRAEAVEATAPTAKESLEHLDELNLEDLMHLEVSAAAKQKQKLYEAPAIVSVIGREAFYDYGYFTLNDAVAHEPGFFPSHDYDRQTVGSRGLYEGWNNNHILQLIDGVPFNDPMYGSAYTWENTPIFMIKSVEVIRGPGSALYGTNATNGVLAVTTLSGSDMKGKTEGRIRAGSHNSTWAEAYTGNVNGNFNYFTGFSTYNTSGHAYESYDASGRTEGGAPEKFAIRDARSAQYLMFKVQGEHELQGLSLQFHDQQWRFQTGHGWLFAIPDYQDAMNEHRQVLTLSYAPKTASAWHPEFTTKYEHKEIDWFTRYAPNGMHIPQPPPLPDKIYAQGISEYVDFTHENYFARAQVTRDLPAKASWLSGIESSTFVYNGDKSHYSNTKLADGSFDPDSNFQNAPPILGLIKGKPITNLGLFTQLTSGEWLGPMLQITGGLRYDIEQVNYDASLIGGSGTGSRTFKQFSPRLAAVVQPTPRLSVKLMYGRAFRAPAPSELAGTSTWALANNIKQLEPETVETFEAGVDWRPTDNLNLKANAYRTRSLDQIGYNQSQANLSTNIYSATTIGGESEAAYTVNRTKTFANLSLSRRTGEDIADATVTGANNKVTWAPAFTANLGVTQGLASRLRGTLLVEYLGEVLRRDSDRATVANDDLRGGKVPAWTSIDASLLYQPFTGTEISLYVKNILDKKGELIKNRDYAFDYQMDGRTVYAAVSQNF